MVGAAAEDRLSPGPFVTKADFLIAAAGAEVELQNLRFHAVEIHLVEREAEQGADGVRTVSLAPRTPSRR